MIAWTIAGTGMLMLAFVFQSLALRRPDLDSGIYIYAQTGFGNYAGFNSAFGYWASNVAGNVFFMVFTMTTLGEFFPGLGDGQHRACGGDRVGRRLGVPLPDRPRRAAGDGDQPDRHRRQADPDPAFIVIVAFAFDPQVVRRQHLGRRAEVDRLAVGSGHQHHARHDLRLPRRRERQRLLPAGASPRGRRASDR